MPPRPPAGASAVILFHPLPVGWGSPQKKYERGRLPLHFGERVGVWNIRLYWLLRSLYVPCYSVTTIPVNVPGWLTATTGDPGSQQIVARDALQLIPSGFPGRARCSVHASRALGASLRLAPATETLRRFQPDHGAFDKSFISMA
jgi:hypothetical protein